VKLAVAAIAGAFGASACCIGPLVFSLLGAAAPRQRHRRAGDGGHLFD
jgi:hypothetical protein